MSSINGKQSRSGMAAVTLITLAIFIFVAGASIPVHAQSDAVDGAVPAAITLKWSAGFDNFSEPLNFTKSKVKWTATTSKLTVGTTLVGASPNKVYQVALMFYCTTFPVTFGQFPVQTTSGGNCESINRQGISASRAEVEIGDILTDINGNGTVSIAVTKPAAGTYKLEFLVRDGSGCHVNGGNGNCNVDFQSPGPIFGDSTTVTIP